MKESRHKQLNEKKWDQWASRADGEGIIFKYLRKAQGSLISILELKENMKLLDIGCGTGWALGQAAKSIDNKGSFYGIDLSSKMIEKAEENSSGKENFHFLRASSESIPLESNFFDIIICTNSFHHYLHPEKAMSEIFRLLKNDGKIYILDPTADSWYIKIIDKIIRLFEPEHVKIYSTTEFKNMMIKAGLSYLGCSTVANHEKIQIGTKTPKSPKGDFCLQFS